MKKIIISICLFLTIFLIYTYNNEEKKELLNLINYNIKSKETYTPNSYKEYEHALNEAIDLNKEIFVSKEEINYTIKNLQNKIKNLYIKPNKDELTNKYLNATNIDQDLYIEKTTTTLKSAIIKAEKTINDDNATKEDVTNSINLIDISIKYLILKPDKTPLENLINSINNLNEEKYTTESYTLLKDNTLIAKQIINNENSTQQEVDNIINILNDNIKNLKIASKAIYKINIYAYMISNNHVGNEWYYYTTHNGNEFNNGNQIIAKSNSTINLTTTIVEDDKIPDYATNYITLSLKDNYETTDQITVRENRGRYTGNIAIWEITYSVKLIETIN